MSGDIKITITAEDNATDVIRKIFTELNKVPAAAKPAEDGLLDLGKQMLSIAGGLGITNTLMGVANVMKSAAVNSFNLAAAMEQSTIAFTTMLGSGEAAEAMLGRLRKFADSTPFEFMELQDAAKRMMAYGFAAEEVIPTLTAVGDAAGALGGGSAMIQRLTTALGQMTAKGKVSGEELRQLSEAGVPALKYLADAAGVTTAEMSKMIEKGLIPADKGVQVLLQSMKGDFGGLMAKQAETASGKLSTMNDSLASLGTEVGRTFIPAVKAGADIVTYFAGTVAEALHEQAEQADIIDILADAVKRGTISQTDFEKVTNNAMQTVSEYTGEIDNSMAKISDLEAATELASVAQSHMARETFLASDMANKQVAAIDTLKIATDEAKDAIDRMKSAMSLVSGLVGEHKKKVEDNAKEQEKAQKKIDDLTTAHKKNQAAILAAGDQIVNNTDKLERLSISMGQASLSLADLNEKYGNQKNIDAYNRGMENVTDSISQLNAKTIDAKFTQEDYNKKLSDLNDKQGDLKRQLDNSAMSAEEYNLKIRDSNLDSKEAAAEFEKLTKEHGKGYTAAQLAAGAQGKYNEKLALAQAELQKTIDKEAELRTFIAESIKERIVAAQIEQLAKDGFNDEELARVLVLQTAMGLQHSEKINNMVLETSAGETLRRLEEGHALDYIKDEENKAIATSAFVKSLNEDINNGLIPDYKKALAAAKAANDEVMRTKEEYDKIQSKLVILEIETRRYERRGHDPEEAYLDAVVAIKNPAPLEAGQTTSKVKSQTAGGHETDHALGGVYGRGNPFLVGERGAEIIDPQGNGRVYSATQTANMGGMAAANNSLRIGTLNLYGVQNTAELFAAMQKEARARGMQFSLN